MSLIEKRRQEIIVALEKQIIPALRRGAVSQVYLDFPLRVAPTVSFARLTKRVLPQRQAQIYGYPVTQHWPTHALLTHECPCFAFLFEGSACEHMAITHEHAQRLREKLGKRSSALQPGIHALQLQAPCALYYPPDVPHSDGTRPLAAHGQEASANYRLLWFAIFRNELQIHLNTTVGGVTDSVPSFQLQDRNICVLFELYAELLKQTRKPPQETPAAALLTIMLTLRDRLREAPVPSGNQSWPQLPHLKAAEGASPRLTELCGTALDFIQLHLHEKLTQQSIASHCGVSCQHLNLAFRQVLNTTTMRYLTHHRIEAAKRRLQFEPALSLKEIAALSGFASAASFNNAFVREMRCTPGEYRRRLHS